MMHRIYQRESMRKRFEEETLRSIAHYVNIRKESHRMTFDKMFAHFDVSGDGKISADELLQMLKNLGQNVNEQLLKIVLAMFDHDGDQQISLSEFKQKLGPFCGVKPLETKDL
jgi:Ca2+-binding EF-hand superfamily protein